MKLIYLCKCIVERLTAFCEIFRMRKYFDFASYQILTKMNQATHLPILIVFHIKNYENGNIFLEKY